MGDRPAGDHRRIVAALIATIRADADQPNAYSVNNLSRHVADADAWEMLAAADDIIDRLSPEQLATDLLKSHYGRIDLPANLGTWGALWMPAESMSQGSCAIRADQCSGRHSRCAWCRSSSVR